MATVVVGGHSRNVGKTRITSGLIQAFDRYQWTAVKISSHWHGENTALREPKRSPIFRVYEESDRYGSSDTSRFLAAGASRALWVQVGEDGLAEALQQLHPILRSSPFVIIESNAILRLVCPDICIFVLRYDVEEFKKSAHDVLRKADAAVASGRPFYRPPWLKAVNDVLAHIPFFSAESLEVMPAGFIEWMQARLKSLRG